MHTTQAASILFTLALLTACDQSTLEPKHQPKPQTSSSYFTKPVGLAINGFNYTDRVIELFSIDNRGGGNIAVSSPTSGGGKTTCCLRWYPGSQLSRPVKIEWMRYKNDKELWCKKTVILEAPFPEKPTDVSVHFMPDGDIKVEVTEGYPDLKLSLDRFDPGHRKEDNNIVLDEKVAECRYGEQ
jgi:hypothetical protein